MRFFYVDREGNLPAWYSSIQLFILALLLGIFTWRNFRKSFIPSWILLFLTGIFLAFSLDEASEIHERIGSFLDILLPSGDRAQTVLPYTGLWPFLIGVPSFSLLLFAFVKLKPYFAKRPNIFWKYLIGLVLYLTGVIGLETTQNFIVQDGSITRRLIIHLEEFIEMVGVTTMIWATMDLLSAYHFRILLNPFESVDPIDNTNT